MTINITSHYFLSLFLTLKSHPSIGFSFAVVLLLKLQPFSLIETEILKLSVRSSKNPPTRFSQGLSVPTFPFPSSYRFYFQESFPFKVSVSSFRFHYGK